MPSEDWISVNEAAERLNVSGATIRRLFNSGKLIGKPKTTIPGSSILISAISVAKFDKERSKTK